MSRLRLFRDEFLERWHNWEKGIFVKQIVTWREVRNSIVFLSLTRSEICHSSALPLMLPVLLHIQYSQGTSSVRWMNIIITVEGYHQYIEGMPFVRRRVFSTVKYPPSHGRYLSTLLTATLHRAINLPLYCKYLSVALIVSISCYEYPLQYSTISTVLYISRVISSSAPTGMGKKSTFFKLYFPLWYLFCLVFISSLISKSAT